LKGVYGWLVVAVAILLSVMSVVSGVSLLKTVGILEREEGEGTLEGRVMSTEGGPISNAYVWLEEGPHTRTNESGFFKLKGVKSGVKVLNFWSIGYRRKSLRVTVYPSWMKSRWGELNNLGKIYLERNVSVIKKESGNAVLSIHVKDVPGSPSNFTYTLTSPGGYASGGALKETILTSSLPVGTYLLAVNGTAGVWEFVFFLSMENPTLNISMKEPPGRYDLRHTSTITLLLNNESVGEWVEVYLHGDFGENYTGVRNTSDALIFAVVEGVYNITVGSPYSGTVLYTNVSTPTTLSWNATYRSVKMKPASLGIVKVLAVAYIGIGAFGMVGAALVYLRRRFKTALASLILLMFSPSPTAFICSLSVLLGLLAIFMLYRIREEFGPSPTSSEER